MKADLFVRQFMTFRSVKYTCLRFYYYCSLNMNTKVSVLLLLFVLYATERHFVSGYLRLISKPSIYKWNERIRSRVENDTAVRHYTDCGGKVTRGPGTIEQLFVSRRPAKNVHCVWLIRAPENHHVYVKQMRITRTTLQNADSSKFDDAPYIQIFDGTDTSDIDRLYQFGDENLNRCLSSGQELTIDLRYDEKGKHIDQEVVIRYGFIETSKVDDLLP